MQLELERREFITLLGGAAASPIAAPAQQPSMPVIGFLNGAIAEGSRPSRRRFTAASGKAASRGSGRGIEYRWAEGQYDRLPGSPSCAMRLADDRLPCCRSELIAATRFDNVPWRPRGGWELVGGL